MFSSICKGTSVCCKLDDARSVSVALRPGSAIGFKRGSNVRPSK